MNNYCTNCGNKLKKDDLECQICKTPIIDLPHNYYYKSPNERKKLKIFLIIITILVLICLTIPLIRIFINKNKINKIQKDYVVPYLEKNYHNAYSSVRYTSFGKCVIAGSCYPDSGNSCSISPDSCYDEYVFLEDEDCRSYYFDIKGIENSFEVTAVERNNNFYVVTGENIYGEDSLNKLNDFFNQNDNKKKSNEKIKIVENYPYESNYFDFNTNIDNKIKLDNDGMILSFFTGILSNKSNAYISGNISNPMYYNGNVKMITKYYDENYNEIGSCNDTIELLGEGYSDISFSCHISEQDLTKNKSFNDITYYKVKIFSPDIIK